MTPPPDFATLQGLKVAETEKNHYICQCMKNSESPIVPLNLPLAELKLVCNDSGRVEVYDRWRRRMVVLTPEEWVRQHFVNMMVASKGYPAGRIANEMSIKLNGMARRCDTVVFDDGRRPLMILEYKAPAVNITQAVFDQIARYAMALCPKYLVVSNGMCHYCCKINSNNGTYEFLTEFPDYSSII